MYDVLIIITNILLFALIMLPERNHMISRNGTGAAVHEGAMALAESLMRIMGSRAAFETCMSSQWFDVAEQIYKLSLDEKDAGN